MLANPEELGFNPQDQKIWNNLFLNVPLDWKTAEATKDMKDCLQFFEMHNVKSVLDVGCGIGIWAMFLSKAGFEVKGYDFSSNTNVVQLQVIPSLMKSLMVLLQQKSWIIFQKTN